MYIYFTIMIIIILVIYALCFVYRAIFLTKSDLLWNIAKQESNHQPPLSLLPSKPRRSLLKALVLAGSGVEDNLKENYWNCVCYYQSLDFIFSNLC